MKNSEYYEGLVNLRIVKRIFCTGEELADFKTKSNDELPDDVFHGETNDPDPDKRSCYWRYSDYGNTSKLNNLLFLHTAQNIRTIKSCAIFFTILSIFGLAIAIILSLV